jgi:sugar/nucleoside kinase (ribokinase family)
MNENLAAASPPPAPRRGPLIVGAGAPLVDLLLEESDDFIARLGSPKGGMTMVGSDHIDSAVRATGASVTVVPGGSACNTLVGIGRLGGRARLVGRLGRDTLGETFKDGLARAGVEGRLAHSDTPTGRVLSVVTPDAQRTMFTSLGAAAELTPSDLEHGHFEDAAIVHIEGYQLFNRPVVERLVALARNCGARLSIDLASFQVVEACRDLLERLVAEDVDILLANEDEARAYTGLEPEASLDRFAALVDVAVVKLGERGALLASGQRRVRVEALKVKAVDTTGAGDLWASGFLYGLAHGHDLEAAGRLGAVVASEVVQVMGAAIGDDGWRRIEAFRRSIEESR